MKSRIQQKRTRRSQRNQKGGKPIAKSTIEKALSEAQKCIDNLSTMMANIDENVTVTESQVKTARLATYELLTQLNTMESEIKKDLQAQVQTAPSAASAASALSQSEEDEDWWKTGPNDRSTMRDDYNSQFV